MSESGRDVLTHRLSRAQFEALCAGAVGTDTIAVLRSGQYSRRRLLLAALADTVAGRPDVLGPVADADRAWRILAAAEERASDVVEKVLMWPAVGVWLVRATRRLHGVEPGGPPLWVELGFLHSVAAAAAVRVRLPCVIDVPVVDGVLTLPTVGQFRFRDDDTRIDYARLRVTATEVTLRAPRGSTVVHATEFVPVRGIEAVSQGRRLDVEIDDCTPYRWFSAPEPPDPLPSADLAAWRKELHDAWDVLVRWHPGFATELAAGLVTVAPAAPAGRVVGASASSAFGGVVLSAADSPAALAATLVHELQHSKLNALLDLVVPHTRDDAELMYAPWRDDPRPLTGLLHGIYAFTSTVEFWHVQRRHVPESARPAADFAFAHRRAQVEAAIESVAAVRELTGFGTRLVESAAHRLAHCGLDDVPAEVVEATRTRLLEHRARFCQQ